MFQRDSVAFNAGRAYRWNKTDIHTSDKDNKDPKKPKPSSDPNLVPTAPEETTVTSEDANATDHLPLPQISPTRTSSHDITQFSTHSTYEDFQNTTFIRKRKKNVP